MPPLHPDLRRSLEKPLVAARGRHTAAARPSALPSRPILPPYLSPTERSLRIALGPRPGSGDGWNPDRQESARLTKSPTEVAYEHWPPDALRRFLAENTLLLHPEHAVPGGLPRCRTRPGEAAKTGAGRHLGVRPLRGTNAFRQIFRPTTRHSPLVLAEPPAGTGAPPRALPASTSPRTLAGLGLPSGSRREGSGNAGSRRATRSPRDAARRDPVIHRALHGALPAAQHVGACGREANQQKANQQAAKKRRTSPRGRRAVEYEFDYLPLVKDESTGAWLPAAGTFDGWPTTRRN